MSNEVVLAQPNYALRLYERIITQWWLPFGLFVFLSGFFWAPDRHAHKVITNYALLLPALLSLTTFRHWKKWFSASLVLPLLFAYLFYTIAATALCHESTADAVQWSFYIFLFVFCLSAKIDIPRKTLICLLTATAGVAAIGGSYAIVIDFLNGSFKDVNYRLTGYATLFNQLKSGHLFGAFAVIALSAGIFDKSLRWIYWIIALICSVTVWLTGSRAPCGALFITMLFAIAGTQEKKGKYILITSIVLAAAVVASLFWQKIAERGFSLRPEIWRLSFQQALEHPWLGAGIGADFKVVLSVNVGPVFDPHNVLLAIFYYGGLIGLTLFIALFGFSFWNAWSKRHASPLYFMAALLHLFSFITLQVDGGGTIGRPTLYWVLYWLPMGLALREDYRQRHEAGTLAHTHKMS